LGHSEKAVSGLQRIKLLYNINIINIFWNAPYGMAIALNEIQKKRLPGWGDKNN
jgi:hypothetical protein